MVVTPSPRRRKKQTLVKIFIKNYIKIYRYPYGKFLNNVLAYDKTAMHNGQDYMHKNYV